MGFSDWGWSARRSSPLSVRTNPRKPADGRLTPEQAIEQARVDVQLRSDCLRRLWPAVVEVIEYRQFGTGREDLAAPAAKYEIHHVIRCGVHRPSPCCGQRSWLEDWRLCRWKQAPGS